MKLAFTDNDSFDHIIGVVNDLGFIILSQIIKGSLTTDKNTVLEEPHGGSLAGQPFDKESFFRVRVFVLAQRSYYLFVGQQTGECFLADEKDKDLDFFDDDIQPQSLMSSNLENISMIEKERKTIFH